MECYHLKGRQTLSRATLVNLTGERPLSSIVAPSQLNHAMNSKCPSPPVLLWLDLDESKSTDHHLESLLTQAIDLEREWPIENCLSAILLHIVGATLDLILGAGVIQHHGASVADGPSARSGDFEIDGVVIHVTTHPGEALIQKIAGNLDAGLRPIVISTSEGAVFAASLLKGSCCEDRADVLDIRQFLVANVYQRSLFQAAECKITLCKILGRYNEIVARCETDPLLRVQILETRRSK